MRRNASSEQATTKRGQIKHENHFTLLTNCLKTAYDQVCNKFSQKYKRLHLSIQTIIVLIPLMIILGVCFIFTHWKEYETNFVADYTSIYQSYIIRPLTQNLEIYEMDLDHISSIDKTNNKFQILLFNKIYQQELINRNFINGSSYSQINTSIPLSVNEFPKETNPYNMKLPTNKTGNQLNGEGIKEYSFQYESDNNEKYTYSLYLSDLMKIFYLNFPIFLQSAAFKEDNLLVSYFMAYPVLPENVVEKSDYVNYFHYPIQKSLLEFENYNFLPYNYFFDPYPWYLYNITGKTGDSENWFSDYDKYFLSSNQTSVINMAAANVLNKSMDPLDFILPYIQYKKNVSEAQIVVAIALQYKKDIIDNGNYQYFSFLNMDKNLDSILSENTESGLKDKYYDVDSSISISKSVTAAVPQVYDDYFRQGMLPLNLNLTYRGINFDTLEFKNFNKMMELYEINAYFIIDSQITEIIFMYNSLFLEILDKNRKSEQLASGFLINYSDLDFDLSRVNLTDYSFLSPPYKAGFLLNGEAYLEKYYFLSVGTKYDSDIINKVCQKLNLTHYHKILQEYSTTNCLAQDQINIYLSLFETFNSDNQQMYLELEQPNCLCIPYYCLNLTDPNSVQTLFESAYTKLTFAQNLILPTTCQTDISGYHQIEGINNKTQQLSNQYYFRFQAYYQIPFNSNMSSLNVYAISNESNDKVMILFTLELEHLVYIIIFIYSSLMVLFTLIMSIFIFIKSGTIHKIIKDFEVEHKSSFINSSRGVSYYLKQKRAKNSKPVDVVEKRRGNVFNLRDRPKNKNRNRELMQYQYSKINSDNDRVDPNADILLKLDTIKEFNEGGSEENEENDQSVLIDRAGYRMQRRSRLNEQVIFEQIEDKPDNHITQHKVNLSVRSEDIESVSSEGEATSPKDTDGIKHKIPEDIKEVTVQQLKLKTSPSQNLKKHTHIKEFLANKTKTSDQVHPPDELLEIIESVKSNYNKFKIDFHIDRNVHEKQIIIEKYKFLYENMKKFSTIFENDIIHTHEESDFTLAKEFSRMLLYEVVSTEICNFQDMCFNFRFKYSENSLDDTHTIKKFLFTNDLNGRRRSSFLANHITNIKSRLKLVEKETIFDIFNEELETGMTKDEQRMDLNCEINTLDNFKSIINYYLEKIHLEWIKQIYENKLVEQIENF